MRVTINLIIGILAISNIAYHFYKCPMCEERLFGFNVSWVFYIGFWVLIAVFSFQRYFQLKKEMSSRDV